jgi:4-hydroxy 2-oxovalerate aldolase
MHAVPHRITPTDVGRIVAALDPAVVDAMRSRTATDWPATSLNYGSGSNKDWEWIQAAAEKLGWAVLTTLPLSGIRTIQELEHAYSHGVRSVRVATHCTEADVARHIATATSLQLQR